MKCPRCKERLVRIVVRKKKFRSVLYVCKCDVWQKLKEYEKQGEIKNG